MSEAVEAAFDPARGLSPLRTPSKPKCDVIACSTFQESDCTYQPSNGPRRLCTKGVAIGVAFSVAELAGCYVKAKRFFAVLIVVFIDVLFGLDWQAAPLTPMPETKAVTYAAPAPAPAFAVTPPAIAMWPYSITVAVG